MRLPYCAYSKPSRMACVLNDTLLWLTRAKRLYPTSTSYCRKVELQLVNESQSYFAFYYHSCLAKGIQLHTLLRPINWTKQLNDLQVLLNIAPLAFVE